MLSLALAASLALGSMPPNSYCSTWNVGEVTQEEGDVSVSLFCSCRSWPTQYTGRRCLACTPNALPDGGVSSAGRCVRYEPEQQGCSAAPGFAPLLALLLLRRWRSASRGRRTAPTC